MPNRGPAPTQPCGTLAALRRHQRYGERPCHACLVAARVAKAPSEHRVLSPDYRPIRNGIPWRPYRYRGSGADAYTGEVVEL